MAKVTFLGLGVMGYPMARHIAKAGHDVTVYNRTTTKAEKWVKEFGGKFAKTPKEASKDSDFVDDLELQYSTPPWQAWQPYETNQSHKQMDTS